MYKTEHEKKAGVFCADFIKDRIRFGDEMSLQVATDSMLPIINPMDRVGVKTCGASDVKPGDIVLFERGSSLIVHRLLCKKKLDDKLFLVPKADRVCEKEEPFSGDQLLGRVVRIQKKSITLNLESWHGKAINSSFYYYSLLKMKAYSLMSGFKGG